MLHKAAVGPRGHDSVPGNHVGNYGSTNRIARRLMRGFLVSFGGFVARSTAEDACETGRGEVLEHLSDPDAAVDVRVRPGRRHLISSVPPQPIWRALTSACGSDLAPRGQMPGHLQHWSGCGFLHRMSRRFDVVEVATPAPCTMGMCWARGTGA